MNIDQATAALRKLYGKKAAWRYDEHAFKGEQREAAHLKSQLARDAKAAALAALETKRRELLLDPEYLRLREQYNIAERAESRARSEYHARRVTVGYVSGAAGLQFFHVSAEGDNWQEAIDAARAKEQK